MFDIYLDGKKIGPTVNLYDTRVTRMEHQLTAAIAPGPHTLTFNAVRMSDPPFSWSSITPA